jgi:hypothetical protein
VYVTSETETFALEAKESTKPSAQASLFIRQMCGHRSRPWRYGTIVKRFQYHTSLCPRGCPSCARHNSDWLACIGPSWRGADENAAPRLHQSLCCLKELMSLEVRGRFVNCGTVKAPAASRQARWLDCRGMALCDMDVLLDLIALHTSLPCWH